VQDDETHLRPAAPIRREKVGETRFPILSHACGSFHHAIRYNWIACEYHPRACGKDWIAAPHLPLAIPRNDIARGSHRRGAPEDPRAKENDDAACPRVGTHLCMNKERPQEGITRDGK